MRQCIIQKVIQWLVAILELFQQQQQLFASAVGSKRQNDKSIPDGPVCVCYDRKEISKEKLVGQSRSRCALQCCLTCALLN